MENTNPLEIANQLSLGIELLDKGHHVQALSLFDQVIQALPEEPAAYIGRGIALCQTGYFPAGLEIIKSIRNKYPQYHAAEHLLQKLLNDTGTDAPGLLSATDYIRRNPSKGSLISSSWIASAGFNLSDKQQHTAIIQNVAVQGPQSLLVVDKVTKISESTTDENIEEAWLPLLQRHSSENSMTFRSGDWAVLSGLWSPAFYHWTLEWLSKVIILEKAGFAGTYVIPQGGNFILQSLALLGISSDRTLISDQKDWTAERLWIAPSVVAGMMIHYAPLFLELREQLLSAIKPVQRQAKKRIYLSRRLPDRPRRVVNEEALMERLSKYGFECYCFDAMEFKQQIEIFSQAEAVVAPHGAGILHTLFAPYNTLVLEMFSRTYVNPVGINMAQVLNHRYYMMPAYNPGNFNIHGEDIEAFIPAIEFTVRRELGLL